jgi:hypothetical protein
VEQNQWAPRHRFIATYISRLIQANFESPHWVLDDFVHAMTNFRPSDHNNEGPPSIQFEKPHGFDFSRLKESKHLVDYLTIV